MTKKDGVLCVYYRERAQVKKATFSAVCANQSEKLIHDKERLFFMCLYGEGESPSYAEMQSLERAIIRIEHWSSQIYDF